MATHDPHADAVAHTSGAASDAATGRAARNDERRAARNAAWEERYAGKPNMWSGRVNPTMEDVASTLTPGTALDVGCGEGADVIWLAEHGWRATGVDVSPTAIARATAAAQNHGLTPDRASFAAADAVDGLPDATYDLVTVSFLHSHEPDFPRIDLLRMAAERVAPGGRMLVVSHAARPPWTHNLAHDPEGDAPAMLPPERELELLALDAAHWAAELVETRTRDARDPDGNPATLEDGVLLLRRLPTTDVAARVSPARGRS